MPVARPAQIADESAASSRPMTAAPSRGISEAARCSGVYSLPANNLRRHHQDSQEPTLAAMEKYCSDSANRLPSRSRPSSSKLTTCRSRSSAAAPARAADDCRGPGRTRVSPGCCFRNTLTRQRVGALPLVAQKIRAHAALDQKGRVRIERRAHGHHVLAHPGNQPRRAMMAPPITSP
jgi:hypothetical protein